MVAIVTGTGLGLDRSSAQALGRLGLLGQLGDSAFGRLGDNVTVNAATGNLMIGRTDEVLIGQGPDDVITRAYNSLSANQGYQAHNDWQLGDSRCVTGLTGTVNLSGSTVTLIDWDGSNNLYTWDSTAQAYICHQAGQAYHRLTYDPNSQVWTWSDGRNGITETFDGSHGGRLTSTKDADQNALTYQYDQTTGVLHTVTTQTFSGNNSEVTTLTWSGTNLQQVTTTRIDGTTLTRVYYTYDSYNRLTKVTTDLSPNDNSTSDGNKVATTYTYDGVSDRVASISQTGNAEVDFTYQQVGSIYKISTVNQKVASGGGGTWRLTSFSYDTVNQVTTVTDNNGQQVKLYYDGSNQLTKIKFVSTGQSYVYGNYDGDGDAGSFTDPNNNVTTFTNYDSNDNLGLITRPLGETIARTYDQYNHMVTETFTPANGPASTNRYAYDSEGHLVYSVDADGEVTEYDYWGNGNINNGNLKWKIAYRDNTYSGTVSESALDSWVAGLTDRSTIEATKFDYDFRGNLTTTTTYSTFDTSGNGQTTQPYTQVNYSYDQFGKLLTRQTVNVGNGEVYNYDGLGRLTSSTDLNGGTTTVVWNDGANTCTVTLANGLTTVSTYDLTGALISSVSSASDITTATSGYIYDNLGRLGISTDPMGNSTYFLYDSVGRKVADVAADGALTEYKYDANNNLAATVRYANKLSQSALTSLAASSGVAPDPLLASVRPNTDAADEWSWNVYDSENRLVEMIDGQGDATVLAYDNKSNVISTTSYYNTLASQLSNFKSNPIITSVQLPQTSSRDDTTRKFHDNEGRLTGILDGNGYLSQIIYNAAGEKTETIAFVTQVTSNDRATGTFATLKSDAGNGTNSHDIHTRYFYDDRGLLRFTLDANLRPTEYVYDSIGNLLNKIEYGGPIVSTANYSLAYVQGRITIDHLDTNTSDRRTWYVYDAATNNLDYTIDAMGYVNRFVRDISGNVIKETRFATPRSTTSSPTQATMASWVAANPSSDDRVTRSLYDALGRLRYTVDGEGYVTESRYDTDNRVTLTIRYADRYTVTDGMTDTDVGTLIGSPSTAVQTSYSYDSDNRLSHVIADSGTGGLAIDTYTQYDALGRVTDKKVAYGTPDVATTHYTYDTANRILTEVAAYGTPEAATTSYSYDGLGNVLTRIDARNNTTTYTYDALGHVLSTTVPLDSSTNAVTTNTYDAFGNLQTSVDPRSNTTYFFYDLLNRLTLQVDREKYATGTTYTIGNEIASVKRYYTAVSGTITPGVAPTLTTSSLDATTTFTRDLLGRVTRITDAEGAYENYTLSAFGDRTGVRNKLNAQINNTFDHRGLLLTELLPMSSVRADGTTEASTVTNTYQYDSRGNRTQMVEASGLSEQRTTIYTYDKLDRLTQKIDDAVPVVGLDLKTVSTVTPITTYMYDKRGDLTETDDPAGARSLFYYDHLGRKTAQINALGTLSTWTLDGNGNVTTERVYGDYVTLPNVGDPQPSPVDPNNCRQTTHTYDKNNRLQTTTFASLRTGDYGTSYSTSTGDVTVTNVYDADGNIIQQTDGRSNSKWMYYNKLGQKTAEVDQAKYITTYVLDANGNALTETRYATQYTGTVSTSSPPSVSADPTNDRVTTFVYDRMSRRTFEYRYNVAYATVASSNGTVTPSTGTATVAYTYNGFGEVATKLEAYGDLTTYTYDTMGRQTKIQLASFTDNNNNSVQNTTQNYYDGLNDLTRTKVWDDITNTSGSHLTKYTYGAGGRLATMTDAANFVRTYEYDIDGHVLKVSYGRLKSDGTTVTEAQAYQYDALGRATMQALATYDGVSTWTLGDRVQTQYNVYGDVSKRGVNDIWQQTYDYDPAGRMWRSTDEGVTTLHVYDGAGNQSLSVTSSGVAPTGYSWSTISLDQAINLLTNNGVNAVGTVDVAGMVTTITAHDARGQETQTIEPLRQLSVNGQGVYTTATITHKRNYNAFGEVSQEIDSRNNITDFTYNTLGKVVLQQLPTVSYTDEAGVAHSARPTQTNYYDLSGRLVGVMDANGKINSRILLANTGYNGSDPSVVKEFHADGGSSSNTFDVFGNKKTSTNEVGKTETFNYNAMSRLTSQVHQLRSSDGSQLTDTYTYDGLGQRITHYNSQLGTGVKDKTDYDAQGRVVKEVDMGGNTTTYSYAWSATAATSGLGTFGGWIKTTVNPAVKTATETTDFDGRTIAKTDFGSHNFAYAFDFAGNLKRRTSDVDGAGNIYDTGEILTYAYYNTGQLASEDSFNQWWISAQLENGQHQDWYSNDERLSTYQYDVEGNRTAETTLDTAYDGSGYFLPRGDVTTVTSYQNSTATWDALNRISELTDSGYNNTDPIDVTLKYDLNSNIRERHATYYAINTDGSVSSTQSTQDDWYKYDAMNRFVTTRGTLSSGQIVRGSTGADITYDAAGERKTATNGSDSTVETYNYTEDGYLAQVLVGGVQRGLYTRDAMGRVTDYKEYGTDGTSVVYEKQDTYNTKSQLTDETVTDVRTSDATWVWTSHYDYKADSNGDGDYIDSGDAYMGGVITHYSTTATKNGTSQPTTDTQNLYNWWDGATQTATWYKPDVSQSTMYHTYYNYDRRGLLTDADIEDGTPRDTVYASNLEGQIFSSDMTLNSSPLSRFYYFDGIQMGDVSNNGTSDTDYAAMITRHTTKPGSGFFTNGASSGTPSADFDASYQPINGESYDATASRYTVQQGDTLQSIAQRVWGDGNFWYLIADANGLSSDAQLTVGMDLIIPNKVANASNNSSTFRVYDPNLQLGDTSPTHPPRPTHAGGCGIVGQIIETIVAVVVSYFLGPIAGDVAKQLTAMAFGDQRKFSWGEVGTTALTLVLVGTGGPGLLDQIGHAVLSNTVNQGLNLAFGLQKKFDWAAVAASAVTAGVMHEIAVNVPFGSASDETNLGSPNFNGVANAAVAGMAGAIAGAATRSLIDGSDFGDNILKTLPDVIGNTVGNFLAAQLSQAAYAQQGGATPNSDLTGATVTNTPVQIGSLPPISTNESSLSTDGDGNYYRYGTDGQIEQWDPNTSTWGQMQTETVVVTGTRIPQQNSQSDGGIMGLLKNLNPITVAHETLSLLSFIPEVGSAFSLADAAIYGGQAAFAALTGDSKSANQYLVQAGLDVGAAVIGLADGDAGATKFAFANGGSIVAGSMKAVQELANGVPLANVLYNESAGETGSGSGGLKERVEQAVQEEIRTQGDDYADTYSAAGELEGPTSIANQDPSLGQNQVRYNIDMKNGITGEITNYSVNYDPETGQFGIIKPSSGR